MPKTTQVPFSLPTITYDALVTGCRLRHLQPTQLLQGLVLRQLQRWEAEAKRVVKQGKIDTINTSQSKNVISLRKDKEKTFSSPT